MATVERVDLRLGLSEKLTPKIDPTDAYSFVKAAIAEGAHLIQPPHKTLTEEWWVRMRNIVGIYYGSPATQGDIAKLYGYTNPERISKIIETGVRHLWNNSSEVLKGVFPLQGLKLRKPWSQKSREKVSQSKGGKSLKIARLSRQRMSYDQLIDLGFTSAQIGRSRATTKYWEGVYVPYKNVGWVEYPKLIAKLQSEQDREKIKEDMGQATFYFYQQNSELFLAVGTLARSMGFHFKFAAIHLFVEVLKNAGIPIARVGQQFGSQFLRVNIILRRFEDEARQVLLNDERLGKFLHRKE